MLFLRKNKYKARTPEETVRIIRDIMYEGNIFLCENSIYHKASRTAASNISFGDEAFVGCSYSTNGKGMTPRYSLASAYGEMMERIEGGVLFLAERKRAYNEKKIKYAFAPDEKQFRIKDLPPEGVRSLKMLLSLSDEEYEAAFRDIQDICTSCVPYEDAVSGGRVYLPIEIILFLASANGFSAGNTHNEALAQGISEVFERAALKNIYYKNTRLKQLADECFEGTEILDKLRHLEEEGYRHKIIDASMDLEYPVLGLILEKDDSIMFDLGADPNPVVALERCLTELFQCILEGQQKMRLSSKSCGLYSDWKFPTAKKWYHGQFMRAKIAGIGLKPDNLYNVPDEYSTQYTYNDSGMDDCEYLLSLIKKHGLHLYVRDFSFLGFPAYHALIPEISLADFDMDEHIGAIGPYLTGQLHHKKYTESGYEALLPILRFLEEKQEAFYGKPADEE